MDELDALLAETSRTFALTIPLLPSPIRRQVLLAYLVLRIADTLEDAAEWPTARRVEELRRFDALLRHSSTDAAREFARRMGAEPPSAHAGYRRLLSRTPLVLDALAAAEPRARRIVLAHARRTVAGMRKMLERSDGHVQLRELEELRGYCYVVAGLVGELLTELFVVAVPQLERCASYLRARAREFGEALQLTNLLKDEADDAREGRRFIPASLSRAEVIALARRDAGRAAEYVRALAEAGAPKGVWAFTALPLRLAVGTLAAVEQRGAGAKLPRPEVARIVAELAAAGTPTAFLATAEPR